MKAKTVNEQSIDVMEVSRGRIDFFLIGKSPLICNAMSEKAKRELLVPSAKKNAAAKAASLKHDVLDEYRSSVYRSRDPEGPTEIVMKATAFKGALMSAALDLPGTSKAQIGRLAYVEGDEVAIYGVPEIMLAVTKSADMKRTPDVRTRAIIPQWCAAVSVIFTKPILKDRDVVNLMAAAGITQGVGDWRVQKGSGNYGQFALVEPSDKEFKKIIGDGGRDQQRAALNDPVPYDSETESLLAWYEVEVKRRGFKAVKGDPEKRSPVTGITSMTIAEFLEPKQ